VLLTLPVQLFTITAGAWAATTTQARLLVENAPGVHFCAWSGLVDPIVADWVPKNIQVAFKQTMIIATKFYR
jgi:hypothetical protein